MRKRLLVGLLAMSVLFQSFGVPAAAQGVGSVSQNTLEDRETTGTEVLENTSEAVDQKEDISSENASGEIGQTWDADEEGKDDRVQDAGQTEGDILIEESQAEEDTLTREENQTEEEDPADKEEAAISANELTVSQNMLDSAKEEAEAQIVEVTVEASEGVYQSGSFTVVGAPESEPAIPMGFTFFSLRGINTVENTIYQGLKNREARIDISAFSIPVADVQSYYYGVINDNPDLYYARTAFSMGYNPSTMLVSYVVPAYLSDCDDVAFNAAVEEAMAVIENCTTDVEKAIALHDYLVLNCEYDYQNYLNQTIPSESFSAYGVFVEKTAVCQGYALAYKLLCNKAGINCYMVTSDSMNHAWNMIQLGGKYYQVDATWNDPTWDTPGLVKHTYLFRTDSTFQSSLGHYDWQITSGSQVVDYQATDTTYDSADTAFWLNADSPIIFDAEGYCYYINEGSGQTGIVKRNRTTEEETLLLGSGGFGRWYVSGSYSYWPGIYSGFFKLGDRLYYNTPKQLYSITTDGTQQREETEILSTDTQSVYSCVLMGDRVKYVLLDSPNHSGPKTANEVELLGGVPVKSVTLTLTNLTLEIGERETLQAVVLPQNAVDTTVIWESDDEEVAEVENGVITAIGEGECKITATAGGKSAVCRVTVEVPKYQLTYEEPGGKVIAIRQVSSIAAEDIRLDAEKMEDVTPTGYTFKGWYIKEDGTKAILPDSYLPTEDTALVALFELEEYTVTYNLEGIKRVGEELGQEITAQNHTDNAEKYTIESDSITFKKPELTPQKENVVFDGWYTAVDEKGKGVGPRVDGITRGDTGNLTLYAAWKLSKGLWIEETDEEGTVVQTGAISSREYTGNAQRPVLRVYYDDQRLTQGRDYTLSYKNNISASTGNRLASVEVRLRGKYSGSRIYTFRIETVDIADAKADNIVAAYNYGRSIKPIPSLTWNGKKLYNRRDFTVEYPDSINEVDPEAAQKAYRAPGTYRIVIKGAGNYARSEKELTLTITDPARNLPISRAVISGKRRQEYSDAGYLILTEDILKLSYTDKGVTRVLSPETDYEVYCDACEDSVPAVYDAAAKGLKLSCEHIGEVGSCRLRIEGKGNRGSSTEPGFLGTTYAVVNITGSNIAKAQVELETQRDYTGEKISFTPLTGQEAQEQLKAEDRLMVTMTVAGGREVLRPGVDYRIDCSSINAGTGRVVVTGIGKYYGSITKAFTILPLTLDLPGEEASVRLAKEGAQPYQEGGSRPKVVVELGGKTLQEGKDYTLSYQNNMKVNENPASADAPAVIVQGKNNYSGKLRLSFGIEAIELKTGGGDARTEGGKDSGGQTSSAPSVTMAIPDLVVNSTPGSYRSTPVLMDEEGKRLRAGIDYGEVRYYDEAGRELSADEVLPAGSTVTVKVTGKGNYTGTISGRYRISEKGYLLSSATVLVDSRISYSNGEVFISKDDLTVIMNGQVLSSNDYKIKSLRSNAERGNAILVLEGRGDYAGTRQVCFSIMAQEIGLE